MKTLVLKCQESVDNNELREMNELRIKCVSTGTGESRVNLKPFQSDSTYKDVVEYRVLSGNGYLTSSNGTSQGSSYDVKGYAGVVVASGESVVQIKNFDLLTDVIGYKNNRFSSSPVASNFPDVVLDTFEIKDKTFLKQISNRYLSGDIGNLKKLTALTYISFDKGTYAITGELSELHNLTNLVEFQCPDQTDKPQINYSLDDIAALTALQIISLQGGIFRGGDIYTMLKDRTYVDFTLNRNTSKTANATCSYVSGVSDVPEFELKQISLGYQNSSFGTTYIDLPTAKALLTMIKDGINASKISLASTPGIYLGLSAAADSELNSLKSDVVALGVSVTY